MPQPPLSFPAEVLIQLFDGSFASALICQRLGVSPAVVYHGFNSPTAAVVVETLEPGSVPIPKDMTIECFARQLASQHADASFLVVACGCDTGDDNLAVQSSTYTRLMSALTTVAPGRSYGLFACRYLRACDTKAVLDSMVLPTGSTGPFELDACHWVPVQDAWWLWPSLQPLLPSSVMHSSAQSGEAQVQHLLAQATPTSYDQILQPGWKPQSPASLRSLSERLYSRLYGQVAEGDFVVCERTGVRRHLCAQEEELARLALMYHSSPYQQLNIAVGFRRSPYNTAEQELLRVCAGNWVADARVGQDACEFRPRKATGPDVNHRFW